MIIDRLNKAIISDDADFWGYWSSLVLGSKADESLLFTIWTYQCVYWSWSNAEYIFKCSANLHFIRSIMSEESQSVSFSHGFVGFLSIERLNEYWEFIEFSWEF